MNSSFFSCDARGDVCSGISNSSPPDSSSSFSHDANYGVYSGVSNITPPDDGDIVREGGG